MTFTSNSAVAPSPSACDLLRQRLIDIMKRFHKRIVVRALFRDFMVSRLTVCQHKQRIVCRGIAVYGNHVEGILHVSAQCFLQKLLEIFTSVVTNASIVHIFG